MEYFELTQSQKLIYNMENYGGNAVANIAASILLEGNVNKEALKKTICEIYKLNDALRTRISIVNNEIMQTYIEQHAPDVDLVYFNTVDEFKSWANQESQNKIDLYGSLCQIKGVIIDNNFGVYIKIHHIISDAWSLSVLLKQFISIYSAFENGTDFRITVGSYKNHIIDVQEYDRSKKREKDRQYWNSIIAKNNELHEISTKISESLASERLKFYMANDIKNDLAAFCKKTGMSSFAVLLTAFSAYLKNRYGNAKFYIGTSVLNRNGLADQETVGMFVNTAPILIDYEFADSFNTAVQKVSANIFGAFRHQRYSYGEILSDLYSEHNVENRLYDILFNYQNINLQCEARDIEWYHNGFQNETLQVHVREDKNTFEIVFDYQIEKLAKWEIENLYHHFMQFLANAISSSDNQMGEIPFLSEQDITCGLGCIKKIDLLEEDTFVNRFACNAKKHPNRIAVVHDNEKLTYEQLDQYSLNLAMHLRTTANENDAKVLLLLGRNTNMVIGLLASLRAGMTYIPVDVSYPTARIQKIIDSCEPTFILVDNCESTSELNTKCNIVDVSKVISTKKSSTSSCCLNINKKNDLIYIIYTSGTTGEPKGVMLERRTFDNLLKWEMDQMGLNTFNKVAFSTTISFDVASQEILSTLYAGGTGYIVEDDIKKDAKLFANYIAQERIETVFTTPSYFDVLTSFEENINQISPFLKNVILAGEAFYLNEKVLSSDAFNFCNFYNHYGPAETHVVTYEKVSLQDAKTYSTIGYPIYNTQIDIVSNGQICGIGMPGEIFISGMSVGRGYFKNQQLTQERFVCGEHGKTYKTGDFARWLPDGRIEYIGRKDSLIKIRGVRVEVKEIENVIKSFHGINDVFIKVSIIDRNNYLFAYYLSDQPVDNDELLNYMKLHLPIQMIPSGIMKLDYFPLTSNGKVNIRALPDIDFSSKREFVAPKTDLECSICDLYADVLDVHEIGMLDDFFELGGHSLKATLLVNRIEEIIGRRISVKDLFAHSKVKDLCDYLNIIQNDHTYSSIKIADEKEYYLTSYAQHRLYAMDQIDQTGVAYNMPAAFKVNGSFDLTRANYAFNSLIQRHEILRTKFDIKDGVPVQIIENTPDVSVNYCDYSESKTAFDAKTLQDFVTPFSLTRSSQIRVTVIKLSDIEHIILFDIHHIIADGVSLQLIIKEFNDLYAGKEVADITVQYKDYSEWQRSLDMTQQEEFWLSQFDGEIPVLNLPLDYNRPLTQKFEGACERCVLSGELNQKINSFCRDKKITPYMLFLSSAMILLSKYSMQDDVVVGSTVSGRTHKDTEYMLGMFVNTVALRGFPKQEKTCNDFLDEIHQLCLKMYENQDYPFQKLVEQLKLERTPSRNPLFDVMFTFQNTGDAVLCIDETVIENLTLPTAAKFDLAVNIENNNNGFVINFDYSTILFKESTMQVMMNHYLGIIEAVIENPESTIGSLKYLSESECTKLIEEFNTTDSEFNETTFRDLFEEQVHKYPNKNAIKYLDIELSYDELNKRANYIAQQLIEAGVKVGDYVAILASRTVETVVGILGIMKTGAAYVPIDPQYPETRINYIIEDCAPKFILGGKEELNRPSSFAIPKIMIEDVSNHEAILDSYSKSTINTNDLLYVIYTSGTTGKPKGTLIENIGVINLREYFVKCQGVSSDDVVMQFASFAFDASVSEMSMSLLNGATMCIVPDEVRQDPRDLSKYCNENGVTIGIFPPQFLAQVEDLHFRTIITAGSATSQDIVKANNVNNVYSNDYGPTEVSVCATYWRNEPGMEIPHRVPIGRPINNKKVYILNDGKLCGINMLGELCVAGVGLARGYLHQDELTAKKFTDNPFAEGRLYHTGDLARVLVDGNIEFWGRIDDQVKIRGYRVELDEVENTIKGIDGIRDAAVVFTRDDGGDGAICAYVVSDDTISISDLKDQLREQLPDYMIPSYMMQIEKLPTTKNGKLDKQNLPKISMVSEKEYVEPRNELEKIVAEIFSEVLEVERVGASDDFFDLGGHSLKANKLISVIESRTGVRLGLTKIFSNSTVSAIANEIEKEALLLKNQFIEPNHVKKTLNCIQRRTFFLDELEKEAINNIILHTRIKGILDVQTLEVNIKSVIKKYDVLRTAFSLENGMPVQKIYESINFELDYVDFRGFDSAEYDSIISKFNVSFDKRKAPLFKVKLYQIQEDEFVFVLVAHPLILDETSAKTFVSLCLQGCDIDSDNAVQGTDYEIPQSESDKMYWLEKFQFDIPKLNLPTDFARKAMVGHETKSVRVSLPDERISQINDMCQSSMIGKESIFLAAYYLLLCHYSRQNDIVIGLDHINEHTGHSLGNFRNTLPLLVDIEHKDLTIGGILETISAIVAEARTHTNYQYEMMIDELNVERDASRNPLYDVKFSYMEEKMPEQEDKEFVYHHNYTNVGSDALDIALCVHTSLNDSYVEVYYNANLFKDAFINVFLNRLLVIIDQLIVNSQVKCENINYLVSGEKETILNVFNTDNRVISVENTFSERLDTIAQKYACKTALVCEDISITYQELIKKVNAVASVLRKRGVNRNSLVPIVMQRSIDAIIALCAVIKSGGAYVPIDPEYPDDRILYTLEDCSAELVISDGHNIPGYEVIDIAEVLREVEPIDQLECINSSDDPMYVIYTSGTTGKPKGVVVQHRGIMNLVAYEADRMGITSNDVVLQTASLSFDASVLEIIWALSYGATLCICPPHITHDVKQFEQYVVDNKISVSILTPQHYSQVNISGLRILATGGAAANSSVVEKCINSGTKYINLYGPTEATIFATDWLYSEEKVIPDVIPIGKPIDNIQIYIMNNVDLCGVGVPGELCIAGLGVTSGYLNRQELTNEKYIMNPFGTGRLYRTGDLARWLEDGNIEYLGRVDRQVKVRGFRIELGEIENAIRTTEGIVDAVVTVAKVSSESIIAAYIVSETELDEVMIRNSLHTTLPDYMLPSFICQIDEIPLTTNGKINYKALPKAELQSTTEYVAPRNDTELILAESFKEVLQYEKIGIDDNFFELGGDSLKSMQLVNVLYDKQFALTVKDIMQYPSIRELAPNIVKVEKEIDVMQAEVSGEIPFIPIQKAFFDWNLKEPTHFNHALMVEIKNKVDIASFCNAWQAVVEHHDMLRTYFVDGKQYVASCEQFGKLDINHFDYSEMDNAEELVVCRNNEIQKSFDLSGGKLIRVALYSLKDCDQMFVCLHHLIVDNVSWEIILQDFRSAYEQCVSGQSIALPLKTVSYKKWAEDLLEYACSSQLMDEVPYWHGVENAITNASLFPETERGGVIQEVFHSFDANIASKLVFETTKVCGVDLRDILLTALAYTVKLWKNNDVCSVMLEGYGREDLVGVVNTDRTVGWFTTLYPFALPNVNSCAEPKDFMQLVHNSLRKIPKRGIGYNILKYLSDVPMADREPEICFNFMDSAGGFAGSQGWDQSKIDTGVNISEKNVRPQCVSFDISLHNGILDVVVSYDNAVCKEDEIVQMIEIYEQILNQAVTMYAYTEEPSEKMNKLIQSGYASDPLRAQVGNAILQYEDNVSKCREVLCYNPTNYQKSFLMTRKNIAVERIDIPSGYTLEEIICGIIAMVKEQDVLRSYVKLGDDSNVVIGVIDTCENWDIPIVSAKTDLEEAISEFPDLFSNGTLLVKIILQQLSESKYQIVLAAQHAVWDKSSSDIFQSRFVRYMADPQSKQEMVMPYYTYAQSLDRPSDQEASNEDSPLISVVHRWSASIPKLEDINTMRIRVKLSKDKLQEFLTDPVLYAFNFTCFGIFGADWKSYGDVPITAIHHGRNDKNQNTLGMFLDVIPVVVNTGFIANGDIGISTCIQQAIAALSDGTLYSQTASERVMQFVDIIPCLNFVGVYADETDLDHLQEGDYKLTNYELASFDVNIRVLGSTVEAIFPYRVNHKSEVVEYVRKELLK